MGRHGGVVLKNPNSSQLPFADTAPRACRVLTIAPQRLHRGDRCKRRGLRAKHPRPEADRNEPAPFRALPLLGREPSLRSDQQGHLARWFKLFQVSIGIRRQKQPQPVRGCLAKKPVEADDRPDLGYTVASALFAGGNHYVAPVCDAPVGTIARESHYRAPARDRHDPGDAKLGGFLQGSVHSVSARYALGERDDKRRLAFRRLPRYHMGTRIATGNPRQLGGEFPALAVEQDDRVAAAQAQDGTMARPPLRQIDLGTEGKLNRCKKPRHGRRKAFHAAILSKADPGLDLSCNPLIPRKLRLFSARRCYNPGNKNSFGGERLT